MALPSARRAKRPIWPATGLPNLGIITAYNDMLSAHQPYETYPALIKAPHARPAVSPRSPAGSRPCATA